MQIIEFLYIYVEECNIIKSKFLMKKYLKK